MRREVGVDGGVDLGGRHARLDDLGRFLVRPPDDEPRATHERDFTGRAEVDHGDVRELGIGKS